LNKLARDQQDRGRDEHPGDAAQDAVDSRTQLRPREREAPAFDGQPPAVSLLPHDFGEVLPGAGDHPRSGQQSCSQRLADGLELAGEQ
jgi:hypothetical protein